MFPNVTFLGLSLYAWCAVVGIICALVVFRIYTDKKGVSVKLQNTMLIIAVVSIGIGYLFAVLFQAVYDFTETGRFAIDENTGMTFYGGLIGGAATFLLGYFVVARKLCKEEIFLQLRTVLSAAACAIAIAHCFGRVGCFMAGCCYGAPTDSIFGVVFPKDSVPGYYYPDTPLHPTQLYEAFFLLLLFIGLSVLFFKTKLNCIFTYMLVYGVFRFSIEYLRNDDRGASIIPFLSPSQLWSVLLILFGGALLVLSILKARGMFTSHRGGKGAE